jgi:hypothetical protein
MKKLSGWQRIFVVIAAIWMLVVYNSVSVVETKSVSSSVIEFLPPPPDVFDENGKKLDEANPFDSTLIFLTRLQGQRSYRMFDGEALDLADGYTQEQVEAAYEKALPSIRSAERKAKYDYWTNFAQGYFVPLLSLYLLGWSIGWIRRGFKNANK